MAIATTASSIAGLRRPRDHIIDVLIVERAPNLAATPFWPALRPAIYALLDYGKARRMADAIAPLPGRDALDVISRMLDVKLTVRGLDNVPRQGRFVAVANHPTGIADGVAVYDALRPVRPDVMFYANADAMRVCPRFDEVLIPVEWVEAKRTREKTRRTLTMTRETLEGEHPLVIFPAGRIARVQPGGGAADLEWASSAFSVARKWDAPVLPIHVAGPWPSLFHFFHGFSTELRDMTLFHELLNKRGKPFELIVGPLIAPEALPADAGEAAAAVKTYVETVLPTHPQRAFA